MTNEYINEKQIRILKALSEKQDWMTASTLASLLGISTRTVKNYMKDLNQLWPGITDSCAKGYRLNPEKIPGSLSGFCSDHLPVIPQSSKERTVYILVRLLRNDKPESLLDLCDNLFISMTTLRTVLKRVQRRLSQYGLDLAISGDSIEIIGNERDRRKMLSAIILEESNSGFFNLEIVQDAFDNIDTDYILNVLQESLLEGRYYVNDFTAFNILLHIVIAIDRRMNAPETNMTTTSEAEVDVPALPEPLCTIARRMADRLEDYFQVTFLENDVREFALLFYTRANSLSSSAINSSNLEEYVGQECVNILEKILDLLRQEYEIDLRNTESMAYFALHLKSLMIRSRIQNFNHNPLTDSIKTSCPLIYDVAVRLCSLISEQTGIPVIDDEIAYIAFHIGNAIETQRAYNSKISVILNCPTYYNMSYALHEKLMGQFGKDILVTDITTSEAQIPEHPETDLILSTVALNYTQKVPCLQIHPFLTMTDSTLMEHAITRIKAEKRQRTFLKEIRGIIIPEFYEHLNQSMTKAETLHYMCSRLQQADFAGKDFEQDILERESLSSTGFVDFAIPHTMHMRENRSCMYILINDVPIPWDENAVQLVIMLCFTASDRQVFNTIFEPLSISLLNRTMIRQILETRTCQEFFEIVSTISV